MSPVIEVILGLDSDMFSQNHKAVVCATMPIKLHAASASSKPNRHSLCECSHTLLTMKKYLASSRAFPQIRSVTLMMSLWTTTLTRTEEKTSMCATEFQRLHCPSMKPTNSAKTKSLQRKRVMLSSYRSVKTYQSHDINELLYIAIHCYTLLYTAILCVLIKISMKLFYWKRYLSDSKVVPVVD